MKFLYAIIFVAICNIAFAQNTNIMGIIIDNKTYQPVEGASIYTANASTATLSDLRGKFAIKGNFNDTAHIIISSIGYASLIITVAELKKSSTISIAQKQVQLAEVVIISNAGNQFKPISRSDIAMRGVSNSQEVLRIVPGLFIGQHQGGGKAEQIFLRGFDSDHGTDIALFADGIPINMVSHAHGQGYADSHFIIPETIESSDFKKGPYYAEKGDFCTSGFVNFNTRNALNTNLVKLEGGMFNTYRALGMFNLLNDDAAKKQQSWYAASEYKYSDAYFDNPQDFNRFNFFTKYNGKISNHNYLSISASTLQSKWKASGQIPERAVKNGSIGFYGAIDPNEGGITSRTNFNAQLVTSLNNGDFIKNQFYYSYYTFDLHTNFTFYLIDSINGDEIRQREKRNLFGYNASYSHTGFIGNTKLLTEAGINTRFDATKNAELSYTINQTTITNPVKLGDINQASFSPFISETFSFNQHLSINAGLRFDQFNHKYGNKLITDPTLPGIGIYKANENTVSPKLSLYYHVDKSLQFYINAGRGFHSNDTRAAVVQNGVQVLPAAYGADVGTVFKPAKNVLINLATWYIYLQQEYVYGGDGGSVEFSGETRRVGFDFSGRYQPIPSLYIDADMNYAHGRSVSFPKGENYIPLAPVWSSTGGITYTNKNGINGSLRYRYLSDRPANEDYSLTAVGYFITDAVINYSKSNYEIGLTINNIFDTKWKETQFDTESRLKNEAAPVDEICFTPGTPFAAKLSFTFFFK